jgi:hypothetical protein
MSGWRVDQVPPMSLPVASSDSHSGVRRAIARRSSSDVSSSLASASSRPWSCNIFLQTHQNSQNPETKHSLSL